MTILVAVLSASYVAAGILMRRAAPRLWIAARTTGEIQAARLVHYGGIVALVVGVLGLASIALTLIF